MHWSQLSEREKAQIEKDYRNGKEPHEIAPRYGLKPKQVSDQAYRRDWPKPVSKKSLVREKATSAAQKGSTPAKKTKKAVKSKKTAKR